jgi:pimeloyl-ACP methyl ester carboxylesterase
MNSSNSLPTISVINSTFVRLFSPGYAVKIFKRIVLRTSVGFASCVAPKLVLKRASNLFITPPRFAHSAPEQRLLDTGEVITVPSPWGNIAAWRFGDITHPAVIMSHGWGGRGAQFRAFVPRLVESGYQVVVFDHIGHGMSDHREAALVDFWRGLETVWDHLAANNITVKAMIGHSLGSAAIASALRRPLTRKQLNVPVPRVVLIAPPASLIGYSRLFVRYLGIPERIRSAMQWRFEQKYGVKWREFDLPESVETIEAPVLFIHDEDDRETRLAGSIALARTWRDARLHVTSGLGHRRILRDRAVIQCAIDFIGDAVKFELPPAPGEHNAHGAPAPLY